jgi:CubicO group peptidase (beta-lactamase class C family)
MTLDEAFLRIAGFAESRAAADATPGFVLAVTDRDATMVSLAGGLADVWSRTPMKPSDRFQIGSMGKAFAAVVAMQLVDEGRLDLQEPVTTYLPWFEVPSRFGPITLHHLLTHGAGITSGTLGFPDARSEVWALRRTQAAWAPGTRYHYSNAGYDAVGLAIARVCGRPYREVLAARVLEPLGMTSSFSSIQAVHRGMLVTPHEPLRTDRPYRPGDDLVPAPWFEDDRADGSMISTVEDVSAFLRLLLRCGDPGPHPVLSREGFERMTSPHIVSPGGWYGYGLGISTGGGGGRRLGHGGEMVGYVSHMAVDVDAGIGAVVLMNGPGRPKAITQDALHVVGAALSGDPIPPPPLIEDPKVIEDAASLAGVFSSEDGELSLIAEGDALWVEVDGCRGRLARTDAGATTFLADHDALRDALIEIEIDDAGVVAVAHGRRRYRTPAASPSDPDPSDGWAAFEGLYRSHSPWQPTVRFVRRGGRLLMVDPPTGWTRPLVLMGDATFQPADRAEDVPDPQTIRFSRVVDGRALVAEIDGLELTRGFDPPSVWREGSE